MKTELFNYELPPELISQIPCTHRGESRLLVADACTQQLTDSQFLNLPEIIAKYFNLDSTSKHALIIINDSKVYPARVRIQRRSGARGEVFILSTQAIESNSSALKYSCLLRPLKKLKLNEILLSETDGTPLFRVASFNPPTVEIIDNLLSNVLRTYGEMPLPPYIVRDPKLVPNSETLDKERYQTVYAQDEGSVAAPTAGLHFTPQIMHECRNIGIDFASVSLQVGLGTFLPVQTESIQDHGMHQEYCCVPSATAEKINEAVKNNWPIIYVGTTALRTVESYFRFNAQPDQWFQTQLFIHPSDDTSRTFPTVGNALITNFHQPESTLVMLVSALLGMDFWKKMYTHAVENKYKFLSYGDSSLLLLKPSDWK